MMRRLAAYEAPSTVEDTTPEEAWDGFVSFLTAHRLQLVADLDPVLVVESGDSVTEVYEVTSL